MCFTAKGDWVHAAEPMHKDVDLRKRRRCGVGPAFVSHQAFSPVHSSTVQFSSVQLRSNAEDMKKKWYVVFALRACRNWADYFQDAFYHTKYWKLSLCVPVLPIFELNKSFRHYYIVVYVKTIRAVRKELPVFIKDVNINSKIALYLYLTISTISNVRLFASCDPKRDPQGMHITDHSTSSRLIRLTLWWTVYVLCYVDLNHK